MSRPGCLLTCAALFVSAISPQVVSAQAEKRPAIAAAAELFRLFGMDEDFFEKFRDGESWNDDEQEPLARALVRLAQIKPADLARWTARDIQPSDIADQPREFSGRILRLQGQVRRVTVVQAPAGERDRYDLQKYYRCEIELENSGGAAAIFALNVPEHWQPNAPIDESASADALFLKRGPEEKAGGPMLYFAADRVAWHPDTLLGKLGMDCGLFDTVQHDRGISDSERECFYQLLAAAGRAPAQAMDEAAVNAAAEKDAEPTARLVRLMAQPDAHEGELHSFRGVARRAVKILVNDAETVARFGLDHYFELVVFVDLDGYAKIGGKKVTNHPVVFCLRELPAGMPTGENIAEMVRASGFVFKKWRYTTQLMGEKGVGVRVASPLLIGKTAVWERREMALRRINPIVGGVVIVALVCIVFFAWWYSRRERRMHNAVLAGRRTIADRVSLDDLQRDSIDDATDVQRD